MKPRGALSVAVLAALTAILSCGRGSGAAVPLQVAGTVAAVSVPGTPLAATPHPGRTPTPAGGPPAAVSGIAQFVTAGSATFTVTAPQAFSVVVIALAGMDGYYELPLPVPTASIQIVVTLTSTPAFGFALRASVGSAPSALGPSATVISSVRLPAGPDLHVSVSWDADSDVDLHVIEPHGIEIDSKNPQGPSGEKLPLDSNSGCVIDHGRTEAVVWPPGTTPPAGVYTVRVDYWSDCGVSDTNYAVAVQFHDTTEVYTGSFTGSGDQGGDGSGVTVAQFAY